MTFDYLQRVTVDGQLEVENIGDCVIRANNDINQEFFLIIKTELGYTEVLEYGPMWIDMNELPSEYKVSYSRFEYNQSKIMNRIDKFLNNPRSIVTQATVTCLEEIIDYLINPIDKVFSNNKGESDD